MVWYKARIDLDLDVVCREDDSWADMALAAGDAGGFSSDQSAGASWSGSAPNLDSMPQADLAASQQKPDATKWQRVQQEPEQATTKHRLPQWNRYEAVGSGEPVRGDPSGRGRRRRSSMDAGASRDDMSSSDALEVNSAILTGLSA